MTTAPSPASSGTVRISGTDFADGLRKQIAKAVTDLQKAHGFTPCLAVVLVGEDPASQIYVRSKGVKTREAGMISVERTLPADTPQDALLKVVRDLNGDPEVHGILVQMPLPKHIDTNAVLDAIHPDKDVDGLGPVNAGLLALGRDGLVPCTPQGCLMLAKHHLGADLSGLNAVVVGRSILVGKPVAQLLLAENCTVTIAHSRTKDLEKVCAAADILVAAVGRPKMLGAGSIKPGATVIDVGINRIPAPEKGEGKTRLVGDVDYEAAQGVAGAITPVPGGVGPMTIACLLRNTVLAACKQKGVPVPEGI